MRNQTHLLFAILFGIIYFKHSYIPDQITVLLFTTGLLIGYLLPDIDEPKSSISQTIPLIPWILQRFTKHRGIFHTIWPPIALYALSKLLPLPTLFIGAAIGYISHLVSDMLTVSGLKPLHPLTKFRIKGLVKTGSLLEIILFVALVSYLLII
jgi:inner membrane protein